MIGTNVEGTAATIPADGVIQIAFDRYLLPSTITRQSYAILDANHAPLPPQELKTIYDPVARTVTIAGPGGPGAKWLEPDLSYRLVLPVPRDANADAGGFRALDRATLAAEREYLFRATAATKVTTIPGEPPVDFCDDVLPVFYAKCASCHAANTAATSSLILENAAGVRVTALNRVAQGANTGGRAYTPEDATRIFGVNMAIIDPGKPAANSGNPGASWLMYKVELAPLPTVDAGPPPVIRCTLPFDSAAPERERDAGRDAPTDAGTDAAADAGTDADADASANAVQPPSFSRPASDAERAVLSDYVLGREMPFPAAPGIPPSYATSPLTLEERERIRIWIARGAEIRECGVCRITEGQ